MDTGFTGTCSGMTIAQKAAFEDAIKGTETFRHGSSVGSDVQAAAMVREWGGQHVWIVAHLGPVEDSSRAVSGVDDETRDHKGHFARNRDIVNESARMVATPPTMEELKEGGTWYTIRYAIKVGKPVLIIWPDGTLSQR